MLQNKQVIGRGGGGGGGEQATISLCRACYATHIGSGGITDSQFRRMRDRLHDNMADIKTPYNSKFVQKVKDTIFKLSEENLRCLEEIISNMNSVVIGSSSGFFMAKARQMSKTEKYIHVYDLSEEEVDLLVMTVQRTREPRRHRFCGQLWTSRNVQMVTQSKRERFPHRLKG